MGSLKYEISQRCKQLQTNPVDGKHTSLKSWRTYILFSELHDYMYITINEQIQELTKAVRQR